MQFKIKSIRPILFDRFTGKIVKEKERKKNRSYITKTGIENQIFEFEKI